MLSFHYLLYTSSHRTLQYITDQELRLQEVPVIDHAGGNNK